MIDVIGIGPGSAAGRTIRADGILRECNVIVGYKAYLSLLEGEYPQAERFSNGMGGEEQRCREALRLSREGKHVALVCSGDAQVYGMASLVLELSEPDDEIRVIPGVTAALSAAALLGAPLSGDFCVLSLSDLMTPWETIEKRLRAAGQGDLPVVLYNPMSRTRTDRLSRACAILLEALPEDTACGWAKNIGRDGEQTRILTLSELKDETVDMFTTVVIGNSETKIQNGRLVTPRGYRL